MASFFTELNRRNVFKVGVAYFYDESLVVTAGVNKLSDEQPPIVNLWVGSNRGGKVVSSGYNQYECSWFLNLTTAL